ncbi:MAG: tetratricopeptide repeat protein, partial [Vulcanimicrobiaceae bacterium]
MSTQHDRNLLERGATALRAGDLAAAERFCSEVLERAPGDAEALNIMGAIAFTRQNYTEAERLF